MRVYLDNCCYNRPFDDQSQPMDYTAWREKHMYLDDDIEAVAARAKAAAMEFDAMGGNYTEWRKGDKAGRRLKRQRAPHGEAAIV